MPKCFNCGSEVVWGADFTFDDYGCDGDGIVANYTYPECDTYYEVFTPTDSKEPSQEEVCNA